MLKRSIFFFLAFASCYLLPAQWIDTGQLIPSEPNQPYTHVSMVGDGVGFRSLNSMHSPNSTINELFFTNSDWTLDTLIRTSGGSEVGCCSMHAIFFFDSDRGFVVENYQGIYSFYYTSDAGQSWSLYSDPLPFTPGTIQFLNDSLIFVNGTVYSGGAGGVFRLDPSGSTRIYGSDSLVTPRTPMHFPDANTGYLGVTAFPQPGAQLLKTTDGGSSWSSVLAFPNEEITAVWFTNVQTGWVGMENGDLLHTVDGGTTWQTTTGFSPTRINSIAFFGTNYGYVGSDSGYISRTINAGSTWTPDNYSNAMDIHRIRVIDSTLAYALANNSLIKRGALIAGASEAISAEFSVRPYPNPAHDWVRISTADPGSDLTMELHDLQGRLLRQSFGSAMDLHGISSGTYLLSVREGKKQATRMIIVD